MRKVRGTVRVKAVERLRACVGVVHLFCSNGSPDSGRHANNNQAHPGHAEQKANSNCDITCHQTASTLNRFLLGRGDALPGRSLCDAVGPKARALLQTTRLPPALRYLAPFRMAAVSAALGFDTELSTRFRAGTPVSPYFVPTRVIRFGRLRPPAP